MNLNVKVLLAFSLSIICTECKNFDFRGLRCTRWEEMSIFFDFFSSSDQRSYKVNFNYKTPLDPGDEGKFDDPSAVFEGLLMSNASFHFLKKYDHLLTWVSLENQENKDQFTAALQRTFKKDSGRIENLSTKFWASQRTNGEEPVEDYETPEGNLLNWFWSTHVVDNNCNYHAFHYGHATFWFEKYIYLYVWEDNHKKLRAQRVAKWNDIFKGNFFLLPKFIIASNVSDYNEMYTAQNALTIFSDNTVAVGSAMEALYLRDLMEARSGIPVIFNPNTDSWKNSPSCLKYAIYPY